MKTLIISLIIASLLAIGGVFWYSKSYTAPMVNTQVNESEITYVALGDSYTIGNGLKDADRWPNVMTKRLNEAGIPIRLIANPAVSGYTVEDTLMREIPVVEKLKPDFVTLFIGANDNFQGTSVSEYEKEFSNLLDVLGSKLENPKNIVLVTIPDYSKSPEAADYDTTGISESIAAYNQVIKKEAVARGLKVADIFPVSQTMITKDDYISDGLHPSAQGAAKWEQVIYPVVLEKLKEIQ